MQQDERPLTTVIYFAALNLTLGNFYVIYVFWVYHILFNERMTLTSKVYIVIDLIMIVIMWFIFLAFLPLLPLNLVFSMTFYGIRVYYAVILVRHELEKGRDLKALPVSISLFRIPTRVIAKYLYGWEGKIWESEDSLEQEEPAQIHEQHFE